MTDRAGSRPPAVRGKERNPGPPQGFDPEAERKAYALEEDVRLMLAFRGGDAAAFDALFRRWSGPLLRYLERMVRDLATAEDLVQEVFLRVHRARDRYSAEARFSTGLYRIATNLALNELRRPRRRAAHGSTEDEASVPLASTDPATDDVVAARRMAEAAWRELGKLPEKQRAALCLTAVEGLSYAEVAVALEVTEKAVKSLVHRARSALAERFKKGE